MKKFFTLSALMFALGMGSANAHFQMLYTPESALNQGQTIPMKLVFAHPFEDSHTMDMKKPASFYVVHKEKQKDLLPELKSIEWTGNENKGQAFGLDYKARSMGDHMFVLTPAPYFEENEDAYIQQITKLIVNVAGMPTDWDSELGLKAEIVPLTKPYAVWEHGSFSGVVMSEGKPVPFAEIEVEYLNTDVDVKANKTGPVKYKAPQDSFVTLVLKADSQGVFNFAIPKAGWWGFAALGVGPDDSYEGKELSQDAVIWVQAKAMTQE